MRGGGLDNYATHKTADSIFMNPNIQAGLLHHRQGQLSHAERFYRAALAEEADDFEALRLMGTLKLQQGDSAEAPAFLSRAVEIRPFDPVTLCNFSAALLGLGRGEEALAASEQALAIDSASPEALFNRAAALSALHRDADALAAFDPVLAVNPNHVNALFRRSEVLVRQGRYDEAIADYERILALVPNHSDALNNRGNILVKLGRYSDALLSYENALRFSPDNPLLLNNRGTALRRLERFPEAIATFDQVLARDPGSIDALNNKGAVLLDCGRPAEALALLDKAASIRPNDVEILNNRGIACYALNRPHDALANFDRALLFDPTNTNVIQSRGAALVDLERDEEALASYDKALELDAEYAECHRNKAFLLLRSGLFAEGWQEYERASALRWRKREKGCARRVDGPEWSGDLTPKRLLLYAEQGFGDTIQFARFALLAADAGLQVTLEVQPELRGLLSSLPAITVLQRGDELPQFDAHLELMSAAILWSARPHVLHVTVPPAPVPYLAADETRVARWARKLPADRRLKVGIVWQGNPTVVANRGRSVPLREFAPLSRIEGVRLISLQTHHGLDQLSDLPAKMTIELLGNEFDAGHDTFLGSAAIMMNLDLFISCDTAMAHLAGALGRPVWIALKRVPDWRWMREGEDTPWYPTARLFRQSKAGDWGEVFSRMTFELAQIAYLKRRGDT